MLGADAGNGGGGILSSLGGGGGRVFSETSFTSSIMRVTGDEGRGRACGVASGRRAPINPTTNKWTQMDVVKIDRISDPLS